MRHRIVGMAAALLLAAITPAAAQSAYPARPIRLIVGHAAGGGSDLIARVVGAKLSEILHQSVIVENRPGASARLAAEYVTHQPADGYTLLVSPIGAISIAAAVLPNLKYSPTKSFVPLSMICSIPLFMVVRADNPAKTLKEFIAWMKEHPDRANYSSSSPAFTIVTELLKLKSGMPGTMIPYKSSAEMNLAVVSGQAAMTIADGPPTIPLVKGGKERALAVTTAERSPDLPGVPTMIEAGYPAVTATFWNGAFAPAGTPPAVVAKLQKAWSEAVHDPAVAGKLKAMALVPSNATPAQFATIIEGDIVKFRGVVQAAGLKFEE
ncbi:MAG TPA: tripartite tricarboxylate transporter substrate binding protein [Xanthobacteraceae bacterium]|nr:tripartite tricarboxylate transporter substrate binding protein [Xanthobacteraceae bacterium]